MRTKIYKFYLKNTKSINNWDLVDLSAPNIVGDYLLNHKVEQKILYKLVKSKLLWERRIAVLATFMFIREHQYEHTLKLAEMLLKDKHDLMHKAVGWMLRELGKRDEKLLCKFLDVHCKEMPRTMLRYTIEKFPEEKRKYYLMK
jgi:3-methyladenine DNA glycosylase AlkD